VGDIVGYIVDILKSSEKMEIEDPRFKGLLFLKGIETFTLEDILSEKWVSDKIGYCYTALSNLFPEAHAEFEDNCQKLTIEHTSGLNIFHRVPKYLEMKPDKIKAKFFSQVFDFITTLQEAKSNASTSIWDFKMAVSVTKAAEKSRYEDLFFGMIYFIRTYIDAYNTRVIRALFKIYKSADSVSAAPNDSVPLNKGEVMEKKEGLDIAEQLQALTKAVQVMQKEIAMLKKKFRPHEDVSASPGIFYTTL
jgi:hypothetical protein